MIFVPFHNLILLHNVLNLVTGTTSRKVMGISVDDVEDYTMETMTHDLGFKIMESHGREFYMVQLCFRSDPYYEGGESFVAHQVGNGHIGIEPYEP